MDKKYLILGILDTKFGKTSVIFKVWTLKFVKTQGFMQNKKKLQLETKYALFGAFRQKI